MNTLKIKSSGIVFTVFFLVFSLLSGVFFTGCSLFQKRYEKVEKKEFTVNTAGKKKIVLNNTNGDIKITKSSVDSVLIIKAEATFHLTKKELKEERERINISIDTLESIINIKSDFVKENKFTIFNIKYGSDISYELIVPDGIEVSIDNTNGKTEVSEVNNKVDINLTNGSVKLIHTTGKISVDITNGKITGDLDSTKGLNLKTTNGNISLTLGNTFSGKFRMEVMNGKITKKDFDFTNVDDEKKYFKGTLGNGDAEIKLETINGKITLTKKQ
jgi:DUF4097 and DUF4098 domain-containing protein YvlB